MAQPMFQTTQPSDIAPLLRVSDFHRHPRGAGAGASGDAGATHLAALTPSLMQDLLRFDTHQGPGDGLDLLEVVAASLRHNRALLLHLQLDYRVVPLTLLPASRQVSCPLTLPQLLKLRLSGLQVLRVEPAREPEDEAVPLPVQPIGPLVWELALRGARAELLPEIAGVAAYRVNPGAELGALDLVGTLAHAVQRLRQLPTPLRELATWPGFDRDRASRLLNGLYLQSALIVSRSHPGAMRGS
jgi:hypothetical protein